MRTRLGRPLSTLLTAGLLTAGIATAGLLTAGSVAALGGPAYAEPTDPAPAPGTNDWLSFRVANMAHSGGENEAPTNTMYAFKRAQKLGADVLEFDVQSTKDKQLVVNHNWTIDETTNGTGAIREMTLKQVQSYDAAYWFVPGQGTTHDARKKAYALRGARTGDRVIKGYKKKDFAIPALKKVFARFPNTRLNIEIKGNTSPEKPNGNTKMFKRTARLLAAFLNKSGRTDVIVTSFNDQALALFHKLAPQVPLAPGKKGLTDYYLYKIKPIDGTVALQIPVTFGGFTIATKDFVTRAHQDGYAVHIWFSGSAPDDEATYRAMLATCADGLMPAKPTLLEKILDDGAYPRPGTPSPPCG